MMHLVEFAVIGGALGVMAWCCALSLYLALCCVLAPIHDVLAALEVV